MSENNFKIDYQGELMKNYVCQVPVGAGKEFRTLLDSKNHPLIFSIGSDNRLRLICQTDNDSAPWHLTDLTTEPVHVFAVAQSQDKKEIRIAYSTFVDGKSRLYYSRLKSNDRSTLKNISDYEWEEHQVDNPAAEINRIEMDDEYMMFSTQSAKSEAFYYVARLGSKHERFELPEYGSLILDFKVGSSFQERGTYLLYKIGDAQTLLFQGFPNEDEEPTLTRFSMEGSFSSIDLIRQEDGKDLLVASGDSVVLYETERKRKTLIEKRGSQFCDIQASQYAGQSSVWVVEKTDDQQTRLVFLTDCFFDQETQDYKREWTADLPFMPDVRQFSCVKGSSNGNHLIVIDNQNQLCHLYQDPSTSLWQQCDIAVEALNEILEFPSYTTRLMLQDEEKGIPAIDKDCYVSASSQVSVIINGSAYPLNAEHPVLVRTDVMGALTIICPVSDISTPILYVGYDKKQPSYILNPSHQVEDRLRTINNAGDFKRAVKDDQLPLWDSDIPADRDLDSAATVIQQLLDTKQNLLNDELAKLPGAQPQPEDRNPDGMWGVKFTDKNIIYLNNSEAQELMEEDKKGFHPIRWAGHTIGSVFHHIKSLYGKLRSFIVKVENRITTFILNIAGEIFHFIIDTLEKIFPFLKYIFDAIGLVFKTLLHWLGRLLGWNDIWDTHKMIARVTQNGTQSISSHITESVEGWKRSAHDYIKALQDGLEQLKEEDLPDDTDRRKHGLVQTITRLLVSPLFSWPMYQILHSGMLKKIYNVTLKNIKVLDAFIQKQAKMYEYIATFVDEQIGAIIEFALNPNFSTHALLKLFEPLLTRVLTTVDELIQGLLDFVIDAVAEMQKLLGDTIEIPFLSPLYKFITKLCGEKETFSFLNGFSLMLSVPLTILYKIMHGGKPFESVPEGFGEPEMFESFWKSSASQRTGLVAGTAAGGDQLQSDDWENFVSSYQAVGGLIGSFCGTINGFVVLPKGEPALDSLSMVLSGITNAFVIPVATSANMDTGKKQAAYGLRMSQYFIDFIPTFVLPNLKRYEKGVREREKEIVEMAISVTELGANVAGNVLYDPGVLSWTGQMMVRSASLVTGAGNIKKNLPVLVAGGVLNVVGCVCDISNCAINDGDHLTHGTYG